MPGARGYCLPCGGTLIRRNRRWLVKLLSLAFLFAQFGMVVHASTHLKPEQHATAQLCAQCLSSSSLQNMVGGGASIVPAVTVSHDHAIEASIVADSPRRAFAAFRSRAPPQSF
jgi:hypothetical protein